MSTVTVTGGGVFFIFEDSLLHAGMTCRVSCPRERASTSGPLSTLDLAIRVTKVLYAAYCSAEEGRRIYLD